MKRAAETALGLSPIKFGLFGFALVLGACATGAQAFGAEVCPYKDSRFTLMGQSDVTLDFKLIPETNRRINYFFLHIRIQALNSDYWYFADPGSGYIDINLISVEDPTIRGWQPPDPDSRKGRPHLDQVFYAMDGDLKFLRREPEPLAIAPKYIFIPGFGSDVWYDPKAERDGRRYLVPRALFAQTGCNK